MGWWIGVGIYLFVMVLIWSCCRVAAKSDEDWEKIVAELRGQDGSGDPPGR
jgi:hypothetical protein